MKKTLTFALVIGCGLAAFACGEDEAEGSGDCPAMLNLTVGETEVSCDDALADYEADEGWVILEVEGEGSSGGVGLAVYEGEDFEELFGEEPGAWIGWETADDEGEMAMDSYTYEVEESDGEVSGSLEGIAEDGSAVSVCWTGLENTTL